MTNNILVENSQFIEIRKQRKQYLIENWKHEEIEKTEKKKAMLTVVDNIYNLCFRRTIKMITATGKYYKFQLLKV